MIEVPGNSSKSNARKGKPRPPFKGVRGVPQLPEPDPGVNRKGAKQPQHRVQQNQPGLRHKRRVERKYEGSEGASCDRDAHFVQDQVREWNDCCATYRAPEPEPMRVLEVNDGTPRRALGSGCSRHRSPQTKSVRRILQVSQQRMERERYTNNESTKRG